MDDKSRALFDKACQLIPGGVNSPVRACHNVDSLPLFIAEAHGSHIIDVDGREYIDFILSWGPMILGHDHPPSPPPCVRPPVAAPATALPAPTKSPWPKKWWPTCPAWKWCAWSTPAPKPP